MFSHVFQATAQENMFTVSKSYSMECDQETEEFRSIGSGIMLSDRYELLGDLTLDLNNDGKNDYLAVVTYRPKINLEACEIDDLSIAYGFIMSLSNETQDKRWFSNQLLGNLDYTEFYELAKTKEGFSLSFLLGPSKNKQLTAFFTINQTIVKLEKMVYADPVSDTTTEKKIIVNYRDDLQLDIQNISIKQRWDEDF